jgi:hypothetical protein
MAKGSGKLMRAALRFLRKTRKRARPDRMNPHFTTHTVGGGHGVGVEEARNVADAMGLAALAAQRAGQRLRLDAE